MSRAILKSVYLAGALASVTVAVSTPENDDGPIAGLTPISVRATPVPPRIAERAPVPASTPSPTSQPPAALAPAPAPLRGVVLDQFERPVEGVDVLRRGGDRVPAVTRTDAAGRFAFTQATPGQTYELLLAHRARARFVQPVVEPAHAGERTLLLRLRRTTPGDARLVAELFDPTGAPLEPAAVKLVRLDENPGAHGHPAAMRNHTIHADGLGGGRWRLYAWPRGGHPVVRDFFVHPRQEGVRLQLLQPVCTCIQPCSPVANSTS